MPSAAAIMMNTTAPITPAMIIIIKTIGRSIDDIETLSVSCQACTVRLLRFGIVNIIAIRIMKVYRVFFVLMFPTLI